MISKLKARRSEIIKFIAVFVLTFYALSSAMTILISASVIPNGPYVETKQNEGQTEGDETEGDETEGDETEGDETEGDETEGDETEGDETEGDETEGDETEGDEIEGDETEGDETEGDETEGDETEGDETEGDETEGDKTEGDKTEGDKTEGDKTGGQTQGGQVQLPNMYIPAAPPPLNITSYWNGVFYENDHDITKNNDCIKCAGNHGSSNGIEWTVINKKSVKITFTKDQDYDTVVLNMSKTVMAFFFYRNFQAGDIIIVDGSEAAETHGDDCNVSYFLLKKYNGTPPSQRGSVTITKKVTGGGEDGSFYFTVTGKDGTEYHEEIITSGGSGSVTLTDMPYGEYTVFEDGSGDPDFQYNVSYSENNGIVTISKHNTNPTVTVTNELKPPPPGSLTIVKNITGGGEDGRFKFIATDQNKNTYSMSITTLGGTGSVTWQNISYGQYTVHEVGADDPDFPYNVSYSENNGIVTIDRNNANPTVTVTNELKSLPTGSLTITKKITGENEGMEYFNFVVTGEDGIGYPLLVTTVNGEGSNTMQDLIYGVYTVFEEGSGDPDFPYYTVYENQGIAEIGAENENAELTVYNTPIGMPPSVNLSIEKHVMDSLGNWEKTADYSADSVDAEFMITVSLDVSGLIEYNRLYGRNESVFVNGYITDMLEGVPQVLEDDGAFRLYYAGEDDNSLTQVFYTQAGLTPGYYENIVEIDEASADFGGELIYSNITSSVDVRINPPPLTGSLTVTKRVTDGGEDGTFNFTVTSVGGAEYPLSITTSGGTGSQTLTDLPYGVYTVFEEGSNQSWFPYTVVYENQGVASIRSGNENAALTVYNTPVNIPPVVIRVDKYVRNQSGSWVNSTAYTTGYVDAEFMIVVSLDVIELTEYNRKYGKSESVYVDGYISDILGGMPQTLTDGGAFSLYYASLTNNNLSRVFYMQEGLMPGNYINTASINVTSIRYSGDLIIGNGTSTAEIAVYALGPGSGPEPEPIPEPQPEPIPEPIPQPEPQPESIPEPEQYTEIEIEEVPFGEPDVLQAYEPGEIIIVENEEIPMGSETIAEVEDEEIPMGGETIIKVEDEEIPLGGKLPKTGVVSVLQWFSGFGISSLASYMSARRSFGRNREERRQYAVKNEKRGIIGLAVTAVCITASIVCLVGLIHDIYSEKQGRDYYKNLPGVAAGYTDKHSAWFPFTVTVYAAEPESASENMASLNYNFNLLEQIMPDVVAWINGGGTPIDYPVMQGADNKYYLERLPNGQKNKFGSLFMDYRNKNDFSNKNTIIYGHRIKSGEMFGSLEKYKEQSYYDDNPVIYVYTPENTYEIQLFAGYIVDANKETVPVKFKDDEAFCEFISDVYDRSVFKSYVSVSTDDLLVSLCTCTYVFNNARFILVGKLVEV